MNTPTEKKSEREDLDSFTQIRRLFKHLKKKTNKSKLVAQWLTRI